MSNEPIIETSDTDNPISQDYSETVTSDSIEFTESEQEQSVDDQSPDAAGEESTEKAEPEKQTEQSTQDDGEKEPEPSEEKPPREAKEKSSARKHYAERQLKKAARKIETLEAKQQELESQLSALKTEQGDQGEPPKEDDFEEYDEFIRAQAKFEQAQESTQSMERSLQQRKEQVDKEVTEAKAEQTAGGKEAFVDALKADGGSKYEDFETVAFNKEIPVTETMASSLQAMESPEDILYALGKNPEEAARIAQIENPIAQAVAMGRLTAPEKKPKQRTNAPAPIKPIKTGQAMIGKDPEKMSMTEYIAWRESQE